MKNSHQPKKLYYLNWLQEDVSFNYAIIDETRANILRVLGSSPKGLELIEIQSELNTDRRGAIRIALHELILEGFIKGNSPYSPKYNLNHTFSYRNL